MEYTVFYKDTKIGVLEINADGLHRYSPDFKGIDAIKDEVVLIHEMQEKTEWRTPISFFKNRIEKASRFNREHDIDSHTDLFRMVKKE